jgi:hypothetical protein
VDGWAAVGWAGVNALLLGGLWRLCRRWFPHDTAAQVVMHTLLLYWAAVVLACFVLGGLHLISGGGVVGAGVILAALALGVRYASVRRGWRSATSPTRQRGEHTADGLKAEFKPLPAGWGMGWRRWDGCWSSLSGRHACCSRDCRTSHATLTP